MPKTPVAIFTYNRPEHARNMLQSLAACARLDECVLYIYSDAPRIPEHAQGVDQTRALIKVWGAAHGAQVIERNENLGLARSIVSGVTDLCEKYGRVIVLEDDFILHPFFIDFMLQSLDRYADDDHVAQVAGFTFPINAPAKPDAFFLPATTSWGWATWQRAWKLFSWETESALQTLDANPQLRMRFDLDGAYPLLNMLRLADEGKVDSWVIRWYWRVFAAGKLILYPRSSLVWQNGFDESATHTTGAWSSLQTSVDDFLQECWHSPISFPDMVKVDEVIFGKLKDFLQPKLPFRPLPLRLKELLKRILNRMVK